MGARYIMTILIAATLCAVVLLITIQLWQKVIEFPTFMAVFGPFVLIAREMTDAYFKRTDRRTNQTTELIQTEGEKK
jgi:hypothetical protein